MGIEAKLRHIRNQWGAHAINMSVLSAFVRHPTLILFPISTWDGVIFSFIDGKNLLYMRDSDAEVTLLQAWEASEKLVPQRAAEVSDLVSPLGYPYTFHRDALRFFFQWPESMRFGQSGTLGVAHTIAPRNEEYLEEQPFMEWAFHCPEENLWSQGLPVLGEHDYGNDSRQLICPHCQALLGFYPSFETLSPADAIRFSKASGL